MTATLLRQAGWRLTTEHAAASYGVPVLVAPDGGAVGDLDILALEENGSLAEDPLDGRHLFLGCDLRRILEEHAPFETETAWPGMRTEDGGDR